MDIQISQERVIDVTFKCKFYAFIALIISWTLNNFPPSLIENFFNLLVSKKENASLSQAQKARDSICFISKKCRNQDRCLKRSLATFIMLWLQGKRCSWCTGYAMDPFRAHAWIEISRIPVNELGEVKEYIKVIKTIDNDNDDVNLKEDDLIENIERKNNEEQMTKVGVRDLFALVSDKKKEFVCILFLGMISSILTLFQPEIIANLISSSNINFFSNSTLHILILIILVSTIFTTLQYYILQRISEQAIFRSRKTLINHILQLPILSYSQWPSGDLLSRITGDTSKLRIGIIQLSVCITSGMILSFGAVIFLFIKDLSLSLITLGTITISFIFIILMSTFIQKASYEAQKSLGKLNSILSRSLYGIRTIRATNETKNEISKSIKEAKKLETLGMDLAKFQSIMSPVSNLGLQISGIVVIGIGGYRVSNELMTISDLTSFVLLLYIAIAPLQQIFSAMSTVSDSLGAYSRIKELTDLPMENQYDIIIENENENVKGNGLIAFENVTFSYDKYILGQTSEEQEYNMILNDISFIINSGECVAIVGPSGAGKSTVLQLIERFYEINKGTIIIDDQDYSLMSRERLREKIIYVEQNPPLLYGTIYDNLSLGNREITKNECIDALEKVNLKYIIERNSLGLETQLGENGLGLSGGEKQRLAMARVILSKARIVLLDELTSNLDSINEKMIRDVVSQLKGTKTIIMVTHHLSTVIDMDKIFVLEHGRIVGKGKHRELINNVPLYRELAKEQMLI